MNTRSTSSVEDKDSPLWSRALIEAGWSFLAAAVLLGVTYSFFFPWFHPEFTPFIGRDASKLIAPGKDLIPVSVGAASKTGGSIIVEDFNGDEAVLVLPRAFLAEDYPFLKVNLSGLTRYSKFKIIWRRDDYPDQSHALVFNRSGDGVTQIAMAYGGKDYRGKISDITLLFYDSPALGFKNNNNVDIVVSSIEFLPFSVARVAQQIFADWTNPPLLQDYSVNIVRGTHTNGMLLPNVVANLLVVIGLAVAALVRRSREWRGMTPPAHRLLATAMCLCLFSWVFNDMLRWHWRIEQLVDTHERYVGLPIEERIRNNDSRCARYPADCAAHLLPYF